MNRISVAFRVSFGQICVIERTIGADATVFAQWRDHGPAIFDEEERAL